MANDNKIVMDIDLSPITARYAELYKDTKEFRKVIKELLQFNLGVKSIPSSLITKVQNEVINLAKGMEKAQLEAQNRVRDNFIVNSNKIKTEMLNQQALFYKSKNSTILFAKNADDLELKSYKTLQFGRVKEATDAKVKLNKIKEQELEDQKRINNLKFKSFVENIDKEIEASKVSGKEFSNILKNRLQEEENQKRKFYGQSSSLYTPSGKYKTSYGSIDLDAFKKEQEKADKFWSQNTGRSSALYTDSGKYKTSAGNINLGASIEASGSAGKKAGEKYKDGFFDAFTNGTTFGHKVATTLQYSLAGMGIYSGFQVISSFKDSIIEADKYLTMFKASLGLSKEEATGLQKSIFSMAKTYGLSTEELNKSSLALGRAGIEGKNLAEATKAVSQISKIAGEDLATVTDLFVSWNTVYPEVKMQHLADAMTAASVATKANMGDLKTVSNYLLTSGQQSGISADGLLALSASMIQVGKSASTAGTEGNRFFEQITRGSNDVKKIWRDLGVNVDKLSAGLKAGGQESVDAMSAMFKILSKNSKEDLDKAFRNTKNVLGTYDAATIQTMFAISKSKVGFDSVVKKIQDGSVSADEAANKAATSYESLILKAKAGFTEIAVGFEHAFQDQFKMSGEEAKKFNDDLKKFLEIAKKDFEDFGKALGKFIKYIVEHRDEVIQYAKDFGIAFGIFKIGGVLYEGLKAYNLLMTVFASTTVVKAITEVGHLKTAIMLLNSAFIKSPIGLLAVAGATIGGVMYQGVVDSQEAFDKQQEEAEQQRKTLEEKRKAYSQTTAGQLKNLKQQIDSINKAIDNKNISKDVRNHMLENRIKLLKKVKELEETVNKPKAGSSSPKDPYDLYGDPKLRPEKKSIGAIASTELQEKYKKIEAEFYKKMLDQEIEKNAPLSEYEKHLLKVEELQAKIAAANTISKKYGKDWLKGDLAYLTAQSALLQENAQYKEKNDKLQEKITDATKLSKYDEAIANARGEYEKINAELNKEIGLIDDKYDKEEKGNDKNKKYLELLKEARNQEHKTAMDRAKKLTEETDKKFKKEADSIDLSNKKYREQFQLRTEYDSYFEDKQNEIEKTKIEMNATDVANIEKKARLQEHINYLQSISNNNLFLSLQIQKTIQDQLNSSLIDFFDISSKGWLNYKKLGMDVLNSIYKELLKQQIVAPLSKSGGELGGSLMKWVMGGFADGGYTGTGAKNDVKGVVHGGEYVIPQWMVNKSPSMINALESIRVRGYADGGVVSDTVKSLSPNSGNTKVEIINNTGQPIEATSAQTKFDGENYILSVVVDAVRRNKSGMRDILKGGR